MLTGKFFEIFKIGLRGIYFENFSTVTCYVILKLWQNFTKIFLQFLKTKKKSSIADALPFPDAIDEPENLTANLNPSSQNENDENVISNLISALSTHSRPPIQSGLRLVLYQKNIFPDFIPKKVKLPNLKKM